jgi:hypothetical protein
MLKKNALAQKKRRIAAAFQKAISPIHTLGREMIQPVF